MVEVGEVISHAVQQRDHLLSSLYASDKELEAAAPTFSSYVPSTLSYAKVADFCEGFDLFPRLLSLSQDLKDIQRYWTLKSVVSQVPVGSTIVEIGAGEPIVADILGRLGYHVIVVDPYEGAGNGPRDIDSFKKAYPNPEYIQHLFNGAIPLELGSIDCIYSISVLEHIPLNELAAVGEAAYRFAKPGAKMIHTIDMVTKGDGDTYHFEMAVTAFQAFRQPIAPLHALLQEAERDAETYYLSAEAHNRWRAATPYAQFPMRRCLALQLEGVFAE